VGVHAVEMAKALGAYVIAETSSQWKIEPLYKAGADLVVSGNNFDKEIKEKTGDGVHLALESVGLPTFDKSLRSLRTGGRLVVIGNVDPSPVGLPLGLIILKGNSIHGSISSTRNDMRKVLDMTSRGKLHAVVHEKIRLDDINSAFDEMKQKKSMGRIMIDLNAD
jgi:acryloyl-coenzyme A reductase